MKNNINEKEYNIKFIKFIQDSFKNTIKSMEKSLKEYIEKTYNDKQKTWDNKK